jgi:hypothetical protein
VRNNYLDETNMGKFREAMLAPHFHQYQEDFKKLDLSKRMKLNLNFCSANQNSPGI